jgi:hypothetical protein
LVASSSLHHGATPKTQRGLETEREA